jgi:hypothetical protein
MERERKRWIYEEGKCVEKKEGLDFRRKLF